MGTPSVRVVLVTAGAFAVLTGCGGKSHGSDGGPAGTSGAAGAAGTPEVHCPAGVPSAAELAATPRADTNLEQLALKLSSGIVADQAVYDRVVRDVGAIRASNPRLANIGYFPLMDARTLLLTVDAPTYEAMKADRYDAWSCLNRAYGAEDFSFVDFGSFVVTDALRGTYDMLRVAAQYRGLPGVQSASPNLLGGGGATICLTQEGATWHYVFDQASGDCPAGCIDHEYTHFSTSAAGDVTNLGTPSPSERAQYASDASCH